VPRRRLYSEPLKATLSGSSPFYIKSERPVKKGWVRFVTAGHCVDKTKNSVAIAFGKLVGNNFIYMEAEDSTSNDIGTRLRKTHHFIADEYPVWYVIDGAENNVVESYLEGYEVEVED